MEAGKYGLTRGTYFVARRLEVVAVAGLLWISWCALGAAGFRVFFFSIFFFFELTRPAASMGLPCLIYLSTSNIMVFVNYIYDMVVDTQFHKFYGRPFARVLYLFLMKDIGR